MTDRYEPFREVARRASLDAIALVPGANFSRLFGKEFHQNERPLLIIIPCVGARTGGDRSQPGTGLL